MTYMGRAMYRQRLPYQIFLLSLIGQIGSAGRPVVTFNPNWNKILPGDSITMSCDVEPAASYYHWYHNNKMIYTGKNYIIRSAGTGDHGEYKCRDNTDSTESEVFTLSVTDGPVILQAPLYVYEGDDVSLRCHAPSGYPTRQSIFYRNNQTIQDTDSDLLPIKYTEMTGTYSCSKQVLTTPTYNTYNAETNISYTESSGAIPVTFTPDWRKLLTGDSITMTCHGGSDGTYWWFQNGVVVAEGPTYTISSARVGHSGTYQCQTSRGHSLHFQLEVSHGPLILQAPVFVYRGADINLRCHSRPEYPVHRTTFYKNNKVILGPMSDLRGVVLYGNIDVSGRYRCERRLSRDVTYTDEVSLHVRVSGGHQRADHTTVNIIRVGLSGCVLVIACVFLIHHMKTEVITPFKG